MDRHGPPQSTRSRMISSPSAQASSGSTVTRDANTKQPQGAILPLPADVVAQIKSSTAITSLSSVVVELLKNSLDAQANKIEVTIDFARGGCVVEDNGLGISPAEFREEGSLGKMYCTSKYNSEDVTYGQNGTFLASLAAMSLLTITSHHHQHRSHNTITLHHCKTISRQVLAPSQQDINFREHGTRVIVRDLFGNMPVRVKQRAIVLEAKAENERLWEGLKKAVTGLLLGLTNPISIKLQDSDKSRMLTLNGQKLSTSIPINCDRKLGGKKSSSELSSLLSILTQASYISPDDWSSWVPASVSTASISIRGAISLNPAPTKRVQFLSLGTRPISADAGYNELYDEINRIFKRSSFGSVEDTSNVNETEKERRKLDKRFKSDGITKRQMRGGRKGVDRWPMFSLRISVKESSLDTMSVDTMLESESKLQSVIEVLSVMLTQWLSVHHFRPQKRKVKLVQGSLNDKPPPSSSANEHGLSPAEDLRLHFNPSNPGLRSQNTSALKIAATEVASRKRKRETPTPSVLGSTAHGKCQTPTHLQKQHFTDWTRIKSGKTEFYDKIWNTGKLTPISTQEARNPFKQTRSRSAPNELRNRPRNGAFDPSIFSLDPIMPDSLKDRVISNPSPLPTSLSGNVTDNGEGQPLGDNTKQLGKYLQGETMTWKNPVTKEDFFVNARTGFVISRLPSRPKSDMAIVGRNVNTLSEFTQSMRMRSRDRLAITHDKKNPWLESFLEDWDNPVFHQPEKSIPQVSLVGLDANIANIGRAGHHQCSRIDFNTAFTEVSISGSSRLSKNALKNVKVIAQVDKKFILVKMVEMSEVGTAKKQLLVLIDQHAADERIRIEALLSDLCTPSSSSTHVPAYQSSLGYESRVNYTILDKPLHLFISAQESRLFCAHAEHFATWGIHYEIDSRTTTLSNKTAEEATRQHTLIVATLPPSITERCKADPKLLISLLRSEAWTLAEGLARSSQEPPKLVPDSEDEYPWLRQIGSCPRGLIDMLNSRACRSAIMFNDALDLVQCEELVTKLAKCAFPFQCAHGRPSMVPLIELGAQQWEGASDVGLGLGLGLDKGPEVTGRGGGQSTSFGAAYRAWQKDDTRGGNS